MSGRTDGFVFPSTDYAKKIFEYDKFLDIVKSLCVNLAGYKKQDHRFGTHILRKTGYLFAIFGTLTQLGRQPATPCLRMESVCLISWIQQDTKVSTMLRLMRRIV
jgi:hypothetical protein